MAVGGVDADGAATVGSGVPVAGVRGAAPGGAGAVRSSRLVVSSSAGGRSGVDGAPLIPANRRLIELDRLRVGSPVVGLPGGSNHPDPAVGGRVGWSPAGGRESRAGGDSGSARGRGISTSAAADDA
jgi:hypothetical protein